MIRGHERFEALAAAHVLGEATLAERAEFAAHVRACERCARDAAEGAEMFSRLAAARDDERWQPHLDGELEARLAAKRTRASKQTFTVLGYAVAASLVLNIAFAGGFAGKALDALRVTPPSEPFAGATRIVLERRAPAAGRRGRGTARARGAYRHPRRPSFRTAARARHPASRVAAAIAVEPEPDIFAGIALDRDSRDGGFAFLDCSDRPARDEGVPPDCSATPGAPGGLRR